MLSKVRPLPKARPGSSVKGCEGHVHLIRIKQAVVDSELHQLSQQVQHLSLQGHGGAGSVLLQSFNHQRLKQADVVVDGVLEKRFTY